MLQWLLKKRKNKAFSPVRVGNPTDVGVTGVLEPGSLTWLFVSEWAEKQLKAFREKNDNPNMTELQTAELRGRIKMIKTLIGLPNEDDPFKKRGLLNDIEK